MQNLIYIAIVIFGIIFFIVAILVALEIRVASILDDRDNKKNDKDRII